ncbi:SprT family protein [Cytobacillus sp. FSL R7-0696]|uniref:SprT family protein n=1 Tax=Cytobacillus sp. FSL R7-0696 TaxID=2921691 RepID=UPI0030FA1CAE
MSDKELQRLVEEVSLRWFDLPFRHTAKFNSRLRTTGGRYMLSDHRIEINPTYYQHLGMEELVGIIKHELCHYHLHLAGAGYQHRDSDFRRLMAKVGAPRHCSSLPQKVSYIKYKCNQCNQLYRRKRRINTNKYRCGQCMGKLVLISADKNN